MYRNKTLSFKHREKREKGKQEKYNDLIYL